jgi:hypothetical protein
MVDDFPRDRPHLFLHANGETERYQRPNIKVDQRPLPVRNRAEHAAALEQAMGVALGAARAQFAARPAPIAEGVPGFYLEVEIPFAERDVIPQLANRNQHLEVVAVRAAKETALATVFVPTRAEDYFLRKIESYRTEETTGGNPRNAPLVTRIDTVRLASVRSIFTDEERFFPQSGDERIWWEVWLREGRREAFERVANALQIEIQTQAVHFPEREVLLALCNVDTLARVMAHSDTVAELRRAKDTPAVFMEMDGAQQQAWADNLSERLAPPEHANVAVCVLDSGVDQQHPLLAPALAIEDCHTLIQAWGTADTADWKGHGTGMAGLVLYGDLVDVLVSNEEILLPFRMESVRILPPLFAAPHPPRLYGAITAEAIARAEIQAPFRTRAIAMAVTSASVNGRPSSWSAAIDQLCYEKDHRRLIILAAGNIREDVLAVDHLTKNDLETLEDPSQAWNALSVGAYTDKVTITDPTLAGHLPLAAAGELCPISRTTVAWERQWPVKPDVVLEGGNLAHDGVNAGDPVDDLQLLTTYYRSDIRPFATFGDTSAATALVARMAGAILADRPAAWPETVRALIVHSAEWTPAMRVHIDACQGSKRQLESIVRRYGFGVPDLDRALRSTRNDLSLIVEDTLQPFQKEKTSAKLRDMKLHRLPWPREQLLALGAAHVEVRATLSYFIEPNPGERGWHRRHRYASHGLRFRMKSATETLQDFRARINKIVRDEEEVGSTTAGADDWMLGTFRDHGSIHSDFWSGSAADLAERDAIGVFPVGGWWKEKTYLERCNEAARYCLIVTIRAPGTNVDIYTPVASQIAVATQIETTARTALRDL